MLYKSTRGNSPEVPFSQVLLGGLAPDGGLYMPERFPQFTKEEINSWSDLEFHQLASNILTLLKFFSSQFVLTNDILSFF